MHGQCDLLYWQVKNKGNVKERNEDLKYCCERVLLLAREGTEVEAIRQITYGRFEFVDGVPQTGCPTGFEADLISSICKRVVYGVRRMRKQVLWYRREISCL